MVMWMVMVNGYDFKIKFILMYGIGGIIYLIKFNFNGYNF